jgi:hypothetical protein
MESKRVGQLRDELAKAEAERDAWRGKPTYHFKAASILVDSLRKQLHEAETSTSD